MRKIYLTLITCTICLCLQAQDALDVPWSIWLTDQMTSQSMAGATIGATIEYRDASNNLIYSETHAGGTNSQGNFVFKVGRGAPVAGSINAQRYKDVT
jgi:hypothetical protein